MALKRDLAWMAAGLLATGTAGAQSSPPPQTGLSLDQAVLQVQQRVGGKVLSAEPRRMDRKVEYRIKVLTPEGHVQIITVPSDATMRAPAAAQSPTKKFPNGGSNKKEKH